MVPRRGINVLIKTHSDMVVFRSNMVLVEEVELRRTPLMTIFRDVTAESQQSMRGSLENDDYICIYKTQRPC